MKDSKQADFELKKDKKWEEKSKKYPKPWTQEVPDQFIKDMGLTQKEHDEWHQKQEKSK